MTEKRREFLMALKKRGFDAYAVGGSVRDTLLGKEPVDFDVASSATPEEAKAVFSECKTVDIGAKHGTVTVIWHSEPIELTSFRTEGGYSDLRHPDSVLFCKNIKDDLARRDFTVNAMAMDENGNITDPFGGKEDLKRKLLRCVGDPFLRFTEDPLRIMRLLRFSSQLGFEIEENTKRAAMEKAPLLSAVSRERIFSELVKLLMGENVREVLCLYSSILVYILPEIGACVGFDQRTPYHIYDVWEHTARVVEAVPATEKLRLAALFHDFGKPDCFFTDENGVGHFYGHPDKSVEIAKAALIRLKAPTALREGVCELVELHDRQFGTDRKSVRRLLSKLGEDTFFELLDLKTADNLAQSPHVRGRLEKYALSRKIAGEILSGEHCFGLSDLKIDGSDVIALGVPEGKAVGQILSHLLSAVLSEELENRRDALIARAKELIANISASEGTK